MENIVEINNLSFSYRNKDIFNNLHISIKNKKITAIIGSNNSGKTTMLRLLTGILPTRDCISINGVFLNKKNIREYMLLFGICFCDNKNQFLFDNILEELEFPLENLKYKKEDIKQRVTEVASLCGVNKLKDKSIHSLSKVNKVKLLIAVSVIHGPKVLLLDNPFLGLDKEEQKEILAILDKLKSDMGVILTTTDIENVFYYDDIIVINNKSVLMQGEPLEILKHDNELAKAGIKIPIMIDLSLKLGFYGVLDEVIVDVDRMVDKLWN